MRVALLTIWHEMNYGAELQAYATLRALHQLGHDAYMIDIRLSDIYVPNFKGKVANLISSFGPAQKKFDKFWSTHIPVTRRYHTIEELQNEPPQADVYIVGSDQVWNPEITREFSKLYFLDFGDSNVRRVSYASSFGTDEWTHSQITDEVKSLLHKFNSVSCRENTGVAILKDVFGISAELVLDPTLLFSEYSELTGEVTQQSTLLYYPLSKDVELHRYSQSLAERLNLKPINNNMCSYVVEPIIWNRISIEQWVKNIAEAEFVITRSFHGLAFSIIYNKNFAILASRNNRITRITNLLQLLGLDDRLFMTIEELHQAEPWSNPVDYMTINRRMSTLRNSSWTVLKNMMA